MKRAFSYEQWETFDSLVEPTLALLSEYGDAKGLADRKALELMLSLRPFYCSPRKLKKFISNMTEEGEESKAERRGELLTQSQGDYH